MVYRSVDPKVLRGAAYVVAASESHVDPRQRRSRATEVAARLLAIQERASTQVIAKRLIGNLWEFEPFRELQLMRCERRVLWLATRPQVSAEALSEALNMEEESRHRALLGAADHPAARAVLWRASTDGQLAIRVARHLRWKTSTIERGQVRVPVMRRTGAIAFVATLGMSWLLFVGSLTPAIWDDGWMLAMFCVTQVVVLGHLLWPAVKGLRQEIADRDAANSKPRLHLERRASRSK